MEIRTGQGGFFVSAVSENRACLDVPASFLQPFCLIEIKDQGAEEDIGPEEQKIAACESYGCGVYLFAQRWVLFSNVRKL